MFGCDNAVAIVGVWLLVVCELVLLFWVGVFGCLIPAGGIV